MILPPTRKREKRYLEFVHYNPRNSSHLIKIRELIVFAHLVKAQLKKEQPQSVEISETNNKTESPANKESSNDAVDNASSKQKKKRKRRRKNKQTDASAASAEVNEKEEAAKEEQEQEQEQEREGEEEEQEIESALPIEDDSDVAEDQEKPATKYNHAVLHPTPTVAEWKRKFGRLKSWAEYQLHPLLMQSLKEAKFFSPTPIQQRCLRVALKEEMDVIGVAETVRFNTNLLHCFSCRDDLNDDQQLI